MPLRAQPDFQPSEPLLNYPADPIHLDPASLHASSFDAKIEADETEQNVEPRASYGPEFDHWLVLKSFSLLKPISRMGFFIAAAASLILQGLSWATSLAGNGGTNEAIAELAQRQPFLTLFFALSWLMCNWAEKKGHQRTYLIGFTIISQLLMAWVAFLAWLRFGDVSLLAIGGLVFATVLQYPGGGNVVFNVVLALVMTVLMYFSPPQSDFFVSGQFIAVVQIPVIVYFIDRYIMNQSRALFRRQRIADYERARADRILYNALPASIADELKTSNSAKAQRFEGMVVMFADLVGFTQYSAGVPPQQLVEILNTVFSGFDRDVDQYQGVEKIKTIGDAYMVVGKNDPCAVARVALRFQQTLSEFNRANGMSLTLRIGIHRGPAVAGVIGLKRFLYDVWGDTVNTASRLESSSLPGRIHISTELRDALGDKFRCEDRGMVELRGKGAMHTWFLIADLESTQKFT
jgi:class 3 adenylate cyclase